MDSAKDFQICFPNIHLSTLTHTLKNTNRFQIIVSVETDHTGREYLCACGEYSGTMFAFTGATIIYSGKNEFVHAIYTTHNIFTTLEDVEKAVAYLSHRGLKLLVQIRISNRDRRFLLKI